MSKAVEFQDLVDMLRIAGFADIVDAILDRTAELKNGRPNKLKLARLLGINPRTLDHRLGEMRELLADLVA